MSAQQGKASMMTIGRALVLALCLASAAGFAQPYPSRPITLIVPLEAGASTDLFARSLGKALGDRVQEPVVVQNRTGASGVVGATACAKANSDGYTICLLMRDLINIVPFQETLQYDPQKDFEPVCQLLWLANMMVSHPSLPVEDFKGLIDYAKKNPGKLNYTAFGSGQAIMQWIMNQTGTNLTFVPYRSATAAMPAFMAGDVHVIYLSLAAVGGLVAQIKSGKMKALALPDRNVLLPGVPSFYEVGLPQFGLRSWFGIFVPAGTPKEAIAKLSGEIRAVVRNPAFQNASMIPVGFDPVGSTPEEFAKFLVENRPDGAALAKLIGSRMQ
jgi:tripartite-type tricarboxylate transporter receptor subunit TctC